MLTRWSHLPALALILAAALIGLLAALGGLQYRWAGELSRSELELTRAALRAGAERLSEDFDRELASAFLNLRMNRSFLQSNGWVNYGEIYDQWASTAAYPKLISDLYLVRMESDIVTGRDSEVVAESEGFEPPSPFGRRFSRPVQ